jgi:hypothetical protein
MGMIPLDHQCKGLLTFPCMAGARGENRGEALYQEGVHREDHRAGLSDTNI